MLSLLFKTGLLFFLVTMAAAATGCAAPTSTEESGGTRDELLRGRGNEGSVPRGGGFGGGSPGDGSLVGGPGSQTVVQPQGVYFASVNANGSGCPAGTWTVAISPDGQTFTLIFSAYEARITRGEVLAMKDCTLDLQLASVDGQNIMFTIGSFYYQGYVALEDGMSARQRADYSFWAPSLSGVYSMISGVTSSQNNLAGPVNESFIYTDDVGLNQWSPCSPLTRLRVSTSLALQNNPSLSGDGYANSSTVDGSLSLAWHLDYVYC
jgi:hypothetical protein